MRRLASILLILALTSAHAQKGQAPQPALALNQILDALGKASDAYMTILPNFYCDEKLDSTYISNLNNSITPSATFNATATFSVRRIVGEGNKVKFQEARAYSTINGKPAKMGEQIKAPLLPSGIFAYAFSLLAPQYQPCFDFTLRSGSEFKIPYGMPIGKHEETIFITFTDKASVPDGTACPPLHPVTGFIMVDVKTMHVWYIELTMPHSHAVPGLDTTSHWTIVFRPSSIDGQSFWMPGGFSSTVTTAEGLWDKPFEGESGSDKEKDRSKNLQWWTFGSRYTNYHKLEVTSTILPDNSVVQTPAPTP